VLAIALMPREEGTAGTDPAPEKPAEPPGREIPVSAPSRRRAPHAPRA
jgi:hypothetical protein